MAACGAAGVKLPLACTRSTLEQGSHRRFQRVQFWATFAERNDARVVWMFGQLEDSVLGFDGIWKDVENAQYSTCVIPAHVPLTMLRWSVARSLGADTSLRLVLDRRPRGRHLRSGGCEWGVHAAESTLIRNRLLTRIQP